MTGNPEKLWTRSTPWRQGGVLSSPATTSLDLAHPDAESETIVIVISHDCDLTCDDLNVEPHAEVIVGRTVANANGNFSWGKSPRTLHVPLLKSGAAVTVELVATEKRLIDKKALAQFDPHPDFAPAEKTLAILRSWLSARYNRGAFPDAFVDRMKATKFDAKLAKLLEPCGDQISHVFFDVEQGILVEKADGDPYELSIVLVYTPGEDAEKAEEIADALTEKVEALAEERFKDGNAIVLRNCIPISEEVLPVAQARVMTQWRLEHMTHKGEDHPGPVL